MKFGRKSKTKIEKLNIIAEGKSYAKNVMSNKRITLDFSYYLF